MAFKTISYILLLVALASCSSQNTHLKVLNQELVATKHIVVHLIPTKNAYDNYVYKRNKSGLFEELKEVTANYNKHLNSILSKFELCYILEKPYKTNIDVQAQNRATLDGLFRKIKGKYDNRNIGCDGQGAVNAIHVIGLLTNHKDSCSDTTKSPGHILSSCKSDEATANRRAFVIYNTHDQTFNDHIHSSKLLARLIGHETGHMFNLCHDTDDMCDGCTGGYQPLMQTILGFTEENACLDFGASHGNILAGFDQNSLDLPPHINVETRISELNLTHECASDLESCPDKKAYKLSKIIVTADKKQYLEGAIGLIQASLRLESGIGYDDIEHLPYEFNLLVDNIKVNALSHFYYELDCDEDAIMNYSCKNLKVNVPHVVKLNQENLDEFRYQLEISNPRTDKKYTPLVNCNSYDECTIKVIKNFDKLSMPDKVILNSIVHSYRLPQNYEDKLLSSECEILNKDFDYYRNYLLALSLSRYDQDFDQPEKTREPNWEVAKTCRDNIDVGNFLPNLPNEFIEIMNKRFEQVESVETIGAEH